MPALIVPAIMAASSAYGAYKTGKAASAAQKASEAQMGSATGIGKQQEERARQLFGMAMPQVGQAGNYWQTLLGGNRAAMAQATAGPRGAITDQYRGAERSLERSGVRGGVADLAKAEMSRDRAGQIAGLTTGVQPGAAASLAGLGTSLLGGGTQNLGNAGNLFGNLAGLGQRNAMYQQGRSDDANAAFGRSLFDLLNAGASTRGGGSTPSYGQKGGINSSGQYPTSWWSRLFKGGGYNDMGIPGGTPYPRG